MTSRGQTGPPRAGGTAHHRSSFTEARRSRRRTHALVAFVSLVVVIAPIFALIHSQDQVKQKDEATFAGGAPAASTFVNTYLVQSAGEQKVQATAYLSDPLVNLQNFTELVTGFGFQNAVLLDGNGTVLAVFPPNPSVVFKTVADFTPAMLTGDSLVSNLKAPTGTTNPNPVIEVTTPFTLTDGTQRVLIGGYQVGATPLGVFLSGAVPYKHSRVYLLDASGYILASSPATQAGTFETLGRTNPDLARASASSQTGFFTGSNGASYYFAGSAVTGTTWKIVTAVPTAELFSGVIHGRALIMQWVAVGIFVLVVAFAIRMFYKYLAGRDRLAALTMELDMVSRLDPLTGLYNRRHLDDTLGSTVSLAKRHLHHLSLLMVDVDHFKRVNDTYGHEAGDVVLVEVAKRMTDCLRPGDLLGRWGGEEFLVVLPITDADNAFEVAERVRVNIARGPIEVSGGQILEITASIGCATEVGEHVHAEALIRHADEALYQAKDGGRNRVVCAASRGVAHRH